MKEETKLNAAPGGDNPVPACSLNHPDDVLGDTSMSNSDKKAILASWASDARAVDDAPRRRQLESGAIVEVDDILSALRALDGDGRNPRDHGRSAPFYARLHPRRREALRLRLHGRYFHHGPDDDDTPPSAPAAVLAAA